MATAMAPPWSLAGLVQVPLTGVASVLVLSSWRDLQWGGVVIVIIVDDIRVIFTIEYSPLVVALHQKQIFLKLLCLNYMGAWGSRSVPLLPLLLKLCPGIHGPRCQPTANS
jgi:hypothetical protein